MGAFLALLPRRSSPEDMLKIWASCAAGSAARSLYIDKTPVRVLSWCRNGLYGLADQTCLPTLIGRRARRTVESRRYGDELRRAASTSSMNSTISLLGVHARRLLTHLTELECIFLDVPAHEVVCQ